MNPKPLSSLSVRIVPIMAVPPGRRRRRSTSDDTSRQSCVVERERIDTTRHVGMFSGARRGCAGRRGATSAVAAGVDIGAVIQRIMSRVLRAAVILSLLGGVIACHHG